MSKFIAVAAIAAVAAATLEAPTPVYKVAKANKVRVPAVPVCDDKTPYDPELGCASMKTATPTTHCPNGYKMSKGVCTVTTYGKSTTTCQKGSFLDGHKCVTQITALPDASCNKGELIEDEMCLEIGQTTVVETKSAPFILSCDKGYKLEKDVCVKELAASATMVCDDPNAQLEGSSCVVYEYAQMECPKGYTRDSKGCIAVSTVPVSMDCPKGTIVDKEGNCVVKVTSSPLQICEKGYELNKAGQCEAKILITGTLLAGSKQANIEIDCKMGQMDKDGNCYQTITTSAATVCEAGFDFDGKTCVSHVPADRDASCQHGWTMVDFNCVKTDTTNPRCPSGFSTASQKDYGAGECVRALTSSYSYVCPSGFNLAGSKTKKVSSSCSAMDVVPAYATCPKGYETTDNGCIIPGYVIPAKDKSYPAKLSCPKGFTMTKEGECVDEVITEPIVFCDKGFELIGKRCQATFTADAQVKCPKNYIASADGSTCTKIIYRRPTFVCPEGTEGVGSKCYTYEAAEIVTVPSTEGFKKGK